MDLPTQIVTSLFAPLSVFRASKPVPSINYDQTFTKVRVPPECYLASAKLQKCFDCHYLVCFKP